MDPVAPLTLDLDGVVDISRADDLHHKAQVLVRGAGSVTVRCSKLERLDASAVQVLLALRRRLDAQCRAYRVEDVPAPIASAIAKAGLAEALTSTPVAMRSAPCPST